MIRRPPRSTRVRSSAASDVYKRQARKIAYHETHDLVVDAVWNRLHRGDDQRIHLVRGSALCRYRRQVDEHAQRIQRMERLRTRLEIVLDDALSLQPGLQLL